MEPAGEYYQRRAAQRISPGLHFVGRKLLSKFLEIEQGSRLQVVVPDSLSRIMVEDPKPVLVAATHRSAMDISYFVEATETAGIRHTRPLSKIENVQINPLLSGFFHKVGLFAADRDNPHLAGIDLVFGKAFMRGQNTLVFPEGTRVKEDVRRVKEFARTPAMMAIKHGFRIVPLAIVGGGVGETHPSRHAIPGMHGHMPVATRPLAEFGQYIDLQPAPDATERQLVGLGGRATREILRPNLQETLDSAYRRWDNLAAA